jgi:hypothetical protein
LGGLDFKKGPDRERPATAVATALAFDGLCISSVGYQRPLAEHIIRFAWPQRNLTEYERLAETIRNETGFGN